VLEPNDWIVRIYFKHPLHGIEACVVDAINKHDSVIWNKTQFLGNAGSLVNSLLDWKEHLNNTKGDLFYVSYCITHDLYYSFFKG